MFSTKKLSIVAIALLSQMNAFAVTEDSLKSVGLNNEAKTPFQIYKNAFPRDGDPAAVVTTYQDKDGNVLAFSIRPIRGGPGWVTKTGDKIDDIGQQPVLKKRAVVDSEGQLIRILNQDLDESQNRFVNHEGKTMVDLNDLIRLSTQTLTPDFEREKSVADHVQEMRNKVGKFIAGQNQ